MVQVKQPVLFSLGGDKLINIIYTVIPAIIFLFLIHYNKKRLLTDLKNFISNDYSNKILLAASISYIGFLIGNFISTRLYEVDVGMQPNLNIPIIYVYSVVFSPLLEEIVCRYYIHNKVMERTNSFWLSALVSAIIFSFLHFSVTGFLGYILIGLTLSYFYRKTNNLIVPILGHSLYNVLTIMVISINT